MSLYYEAAPLMITTSDSGDSLRSRIFNSKDLVSQPKQVYALVNEAAKWSPILAGVIERSQLLQHERKLTPKLALLLVHDLLLAKRGISAPTTHPLRASVEKHKARLSAELKRARLKRGFASTENLRAYIDKGNLAIEEKDNGIVANGGNQIVQSSAKWSHPRWVRVNSLKTDLSEQMRTTFAGYHALDSLEELQALSQQSTEKLLHVDKHIPNLIALSPTTDLTKTPAYLNGLVILQDKASCIPAYLLNPSPSNGPILDACAAPGNKTTHLAAVMQHNKSDAQNEYIYACERDQNRAATLSQMVNLAGASEHVIIKKGQDFLRIEPDKYPWNEVGSLLLDPSCSGSGITAREETLKVILPSENDKTFNAKQSRKRKRESKGEGRTEVVEEETPIIGDQPPDKLSARLSALSTFQLKLLLHAFSFPKSRRITYSTCSIYGEENEQVVTKALNSEIAKAWAWRILRREEQVAGMKSWVIRGDLQACTGAVDSTNLSEIAEACIRCEKGTKEGTQGFFVAAFTRDEEVFMSSELSDQEWEGFSDDEAPS